MRGPLIEFLTPRRPVSRKLLIGYALWTVVSASLVHAFVPRDAFSPLRDATFGLLGGTLVLALPAFAILWLVLGRWGRQTLADLGLHRDQALVAVAATAGLWLAMQGIQVLLALRRGAPVELHPSWTATGTGFLIGTLLGQLFGNAPFEEIVFRRFMLGQTVHQLRGLRSPLGRIVLAVVLSQLFFWAMHFPAALRSGVPVELLVEKTDIILLAGFVFTWIYLQTRNLFLAMGYHVLSNVPTPLVGESVNAFWLTQRVGWALLVLHLVWLGGAWLRSRRGRTPSPARERSER